MMAFTAMAADAREAGQPPAAARDRRHPASALGVHGQNLGAIHGPLCLVQLVSVVRVHDESLPARFGVVIHMTNGHGANRHLAEPDLDLLSVR